MHPAQLYSAVQLRTQHHPPLLPFFSFYPSLFLSPSSSLPLYHTSSLLPSFPLSLSAWLTASYIHDRGEALEGSDGGEMGKRRHGHPPPLRSNMRSISAVLLPAFAVLMAMASGLLDSAMPVFRTNSSSTRRAKGASLFIASFTTYTTPSKAWLAHFSLPSLHPATSTSTSLQSRKGRGLAETRLELQLSSAGSCRRERRRLSTKVDLPLPVSPMMRLV
mmetsp:Transcript_43456/g.113116  ORF Transcript_43456/g.113116 Transcript_43456/m.113116 type:complete len:219 (-) Transcript_43456:162-818(-)